MYDLKEFDKIIVFTGPYGSGRKTLADMAGSTLGLKEVLSYTTRAPRPGENDGEDYFFISQEQFLTAKDNGEFIEVTELRGHSYGIKSRDLEQMVEQSGGVYLVLNGYGANLIKALYQEQVIRLFIYAERETVRERLKERGDSDALIEENLAIYDQELVYESDCEHVFENSESAHTIFALSNILEGYLNRNLIEKD